MATPKKSANINSTIGRMPSTAAPTPRPMKAVSEIGVSSTRSRAELVEQPAGGTEDAAVLADVLAEHEDAWVAVHLLGDALGDGAGSGQPALDRRVHWRAWPRNQ